MTEASLEERVTVLEKQVAQLMAGGNQAPTNKSWRNTLGMFANDPVMKEIQEEGCKIREADREQAQRDYS